MDDLQRICVVNCGLPAHECACYRGLCVALDLPQNHAARIKQLEAKLAVATVSQADAASAIERALKDKAIRDDWAWVFEDIHAALIGKVKS